MHNRDSFDTVEQTSRSSPRKIDFMQIHAKNKINKGLLSNVYRCVLCFTVVGSKARNTPPCSSRQEIMDQRKWKLIEPRSCIYAEVKCKKVTLLKGGKTFSLSHPLNKCIQHVRVKAATKNVRPLETNKINAIIFFFYLEIKNITSIFNSVINI